ncbi:MAG: arginine deiminase-related protein [Rhizomicrobium sp.]
MSPRVFDFTHAIARVPGHSVVNGLRDNTSVTPTFERVLEQHTAYVAALRKAGLAVDVLPALEAFPDSVFVEDPAIVMPEGAIVMRPGAPSRLRETDEIRGALGRHFPRVLELGTEGFADGGDILITPETILSASPPAPTAPAPKTCAPSSKSSAVNPASPKPRPVFFTSRRFRRS